MPRKASDHYDSVTDSWKEFMGDHFHFGYFETADMDLEGAGVTMIEKMLELCSITGESRVLDVGCGIGGPAIYMHEKLGCAVDGISTSERGVRLANAASREMGYRDDVRFKVADGLDNGFPDGTFDVAWIMETSHLIPDRKKLFRESFRALKEDGTLVLCDLVVLMRPVYKVLWHIMANGRKYFRSIRAWGPVQLGYLGHYCDTLIAAGFREADIINITEETLPTMRWWKDNARRFLDSEVGASPPDDIQDFIYGCDTAEELFNKGVLGYGMLRALK
jgi:27-O-demethylrifamycin SV methyltransferase